MGNVDQDRASVAFMLRVKDNEIQSLRAKMNLSTTEHSQSKELVEVEKERVQMKSQIRAVTERNNKNEQIILN